VINPNGKNRASKRYLLWWLNLLTFQRTKIVDRNPELSKWVPHQTAGVQKRIFRQTQKTKKPFSRHFYADNTFSFGRGGKFNSSH
jgi:uncharacterized protein with gpF-like domain